jgi:hypothetical protein
MVGIMTFENDLTAWAIIGGLSALYFVFLIIISVSWHSERKILLQEIKDLRDRFMAKDFHDYAVGRHIMDKKPMTDAEYVEQLYDITKEDKEQADRLPVT